jgi:ketosteroid isomerase-like protein
MSQANVELVRPAFEWTFTEDTWPTPVLRRIFHEDLIYHPRPDEPDPSPHIGRDAFELLIRGFVEAFAEITFDILELLDAGDYVIASTILHGRGSVSGAGVSDAYVFVYKVRDAVVVEGWEFRTMQEALELAGDEA